jgi:hypothetical protein
MQSKKHILAGSEAFFMLFLRTIDAYKDDAKLQTSADSETINREKKIRVAMAQRSVKDLRHLIELAELLERTGRLEVRTAAALA